MTPAQTARVRRAGADDMPRGAMPPQALAFFNTLTDAQRDMLASMSGLTENERSELGDALVEAAIASQSSGDAKSGLEKLRAAGGTGPAFVAFGERAVVHRYVSQQQLERIAARLMSYPTADEREAETVKAMRRFIASDQPLFEVRLVDCPVRHKRAPKVDLNGLKARMDVMSSMPGGTPERYNVAVKLPSSGGGGGGGGSDDEDDDDDDDDDEPNCVVQVEPRHLRPCPLSEDCRDEMAEKIPEDHAAEAWWAEKEERYAQMQRVGLGNYGPPRPG